MGKLKRKIINYSFSKRLIQWMVEFTDKLLARSAQIAQIRGAIAAVESENRDLELTQIVLRSRIRYNVARSGRRVRWLFVVTIPEMWDALASVYAAALDDPFFEVLVMPLPRNLGDGFSHYQQNRDFLVRKKIPFIEGVTEDGRVRTLEELQPDLVTVQTHWELQLPNRFHMQTLRAFDVVYIPYGFMLANIEDQQFGRPFHKNAWLIFCETPEHKKLYVKHGYEDSDRLVVSGLPKFELYAESVHSKENARKVVVWAPHHSVSEKWLGFSTFPKFCHYFIELMKSNPEIDFVLRPHPALWIQMKLEKGWSDQDIASYKSKFAAAGGTIYENEGADELFARSDALICDGVSFFAEYMPTGKPILFLDSGMNVGFNSAGQYILNGLYRAGCEDEIESFLRDVVIEGKDVKRSIRDDITKSHLLPVGRKIGKFIVEEVKRKYEFKDLL